MESNLSARRLREMIRARQWTKPTSGAAAGYVQANLVMLPNPSSAVKKCQRRDIK
jgi:uncharacterized protein YcsI (UPF0317 family)